MQQTMKDRICMVTGANAGIGKETALGLARLGATVIMVCRNQAKGEAAQAEIRAASGSNSVDLMLADLSSQASIRELAANFKAKYQQLHVLVNNAGAIFMRRQVTEDGLELTFALNHLNYFLLTNLLLDTLKASAPARIVNVSSAAHWKRRINFDDLLSETGYRGMDVYGQSKLANILFTRELARRLEGTGVTANCLHPGFVGSNFAANNGFLPALGMRLMKPFILSSAQGAETSIYLASSPEVAGKSGGYYVNKRESSSDRASQDTAAAEKLWQVSKQLTAATHS